MLQLTRLILNNEYWILRGYSIDWRNRVASFLQHNSIMCAGVWVCVCVCASDPHENFICVKHLICIDSKKQRGRRRSKLGERRAPKMSTNQYTYAMLVCPKLCAPVYLCVCVSVWRGKANESWPAANSLNSFNQHKAFNLAKRITHTHIRTHTRTHM